eukprot:UC4_evm1s1233
MSWSTISSAAAVIFLMSASSTVATIFTNDRELAAMNTSSTLYSQTPAECIRSLSKPGDQCLLAPGNYTKIELGLHPSDPSYDNGTLIIRGLHGTYGNRIKIASSTGNPSDVIFDGTLPIPSACEESWEMTSTPGIWRCSFGVDASQPPPHSAIPGITQLFVDREMMVPARWPNARFDDRSIYFGPERWAHTRPGGYHNTTTGKGLVKDAGQCNVSDPNPLFHTCCSYCNANSLSESGINATGASMILNAWADGTGAEIIKFHNPGTDSLIYDATWCKDEIIKRGKCSDGFRGGYGKYFLEGTLALLDAATEFHYERGSGMLYLYTLDGKRPKPGSVRYKAQTYALDFYDSTFITLANVSFFATAIRAYDDDLKYDTTRLTNFQFESLDFKFPDASRRSLGDPITRETNVVYSETSSWSNHSFVDLSFRYADSGAFIVGGNGISFRNCLWEWNSWTAFCAGSPDPSDGNCATLLVDGSPPVDEVTGAVLPMFERLTFRYNGPSKCLRPPHAPNLQIRLIHFESQLQLASDGTFVETGGNNSAHMFNNWCHSSGKSALRFDGTSKTGTSNGAMIFNVAWNVTGFSVKGDKHNVSYNTHFDVDDVGASFASRSLPEPQGPFSDIDKLNITDMAGMNVENPGANTEFANTNSTFIGNIIDFVANKDACDRPESCPFAGEWHNNVIRSSSALPQQTKVKQEFFRIREQIRDPINRDFRPCQDSLAASRGAGSYPVYSEKDTHYWIPGALQRIPSEPSPLDGAASVNIDADLIFLPAFRSSGSRIYFGESSENLRFLGELKGEANIGHTGVKKPNTQYFWRVDPVGGNRGELWSFTTGSRMSCPPPSPPPPPPSIPTACRKEIEACCSKATGEPLKQCLNILKRHNATLLDCNEEDHNSFCRGINVLKERCRTLSKKITTKPESSVI